MERTRRRETSANSETNIHISEGQGNLDLVDSTTLPESGAPPYTCCF